MSTPLSPTNRRRAKAAAVAVEKVDKSLQTPPATTRSKARQNDASQEAMQLPSIFSRTAPEFLHPFLASDPAKRDGEWFFLWYSPVWIGFFGIVVVFRLWEGISDLGYNTIGLICAAPCVLIPIFWPSPAEATKKWYQRYSFKANVWVAAFNFVGNYFWTHYFFALLGAKYTFPIKYLINKIPPVCFLLTQPYFQTYHHTSNLALRYLRRKMDPTWLRFALTIALVLAVSVFWSFAETKTIESFPYYEFEDRTRMYQIGIMFYALYFIVSFPMFIRLDENPKDKWDWKRSLLDSLAAAMIVFILCDFWRLTVGNILPSKATSTLPFL